MLACLRGFPWTTVGSSSTGGKSDKLQYLSMMWGPFKDPFLWKLKQIKKTESDLPVSSCNTPSILLFTRILIKVFSYFLKIKHPYIMKFCFTKGYVDIKILWYDYLLKYQISKKAMYTWQRTQILDRLWNLIKCVIPKLEVPTLLQLWT